MTTNRRVVQATPEQVWRVLADGWLYPVWVVGASRMREVDGSWPESGARLHHSVGVWPLLIDDSTEVLESQRDTSIRLRARAWPVGEAEVAIELHAQPDGSTEIVMHEDAVAGPGRLVPPPVRGLSLKWRNVEALRRLAYLAERRS
ncbi:SRPBCC family protein [Nocardioides sp.]|uniref:SRPBCC family protein n=1 Tax=Nocardioides sp. TaxID=35761 RepID=UPI002737633E|nr:SRPBCC family protein [Nocardioides sp.]MDP3893962.1 SRPBCC family protein [Nocardioides sp.]